MDKAVELRAYGALAGLSEGSLRDLAVEMEVLSFEASREVDLSDRLQGGLCVLMSGEARVFRGELEVFQLQCGDSVGAMGEFPIGRNGLTLHARTALTLACWSDAVVERWPLTRPGLLAELLRNLSEVLRKRVDELMSALALVHETRSQPLRSEILVRMGEEQQRVRAGTPVGHLLPRDVDGERVIAGLVDRKTTSLSRPLYGSAALEPLTRRTWEGRAVYRHSLGLLALEAAWRVDPEIQIRIGPSLGFAHILELGASNGFSRAELADKLTAKMREMVAENVTFRRERWSVEEARLQFMAQGWEDAARLLRNWRNSTVPLVSCGDIFGLEFGPMVNSAEVLSRFEVVDHDADLLLYFGDAEKRSKALVQSAHPGRLAREHQQWLRALGLDSVGAFNDACIAGDVSEIIRVSEGFHEKRISQIADMISQRGDVRVVCISGPSSSGKTTFLKRLSVQLQVNGLRPRCISLDNYYVDREFTVRDENGEYDFEAFEALNCELLADQLQRLVAGETVKLARYDFATGLSHPEGGAAMRMEDGDVLLLEGIHALNPRLPGADSESTFRIFINPMTSLPLDHVTRVSVADLRLLRRIVRDRHGRAITAAENIMRWPSVRRGERVHIFPYQERADAVFNTSLIYEPSVLKVYAERYLLEVSEGHPAHTTAYRLRRLIDKFVAIYPDRVPQTSLLREFIGGSSFEH